MSEPVATWLYAITPRLPALVLPVTGVAGEPVRVVAHADVAAVVGSVDLDHHDEDRLRERLADPAWLEQAVRRHHRVVAATFDAAPTVPLRFGTVYHDDGRVGDLLEQGYRQLVEALSRVRQRAEWGVQAFADAAPPPDRPVPAAPGPARPGTAYLQRRRVQRAWQQHRHRSAAEAAEQLQAALTPLAVAARRQPPARHPDQPGRMVLNSAFLVDDDRRGEFARAVRGFDGADTELQIRVTGPWPAYSFVEVDVEPAKGRP